MPIAKEKLARRKLQAEFDRVYPVWDHIDFACDRETDDSLTWIFYPQGENTKHEWIYSYKTKTITKVSVPYVN